MTYFETTTLLTKDDFGLVTRGLPLFVRNSLRLLLSLKRGELILQLPDGRVLKIIGEEPGIHAVLSLKNYGIAKRVLHSGDVGVAESYIAEEWDSPDVTAVLLLFCQNTYAMNIGRSRSFMSGFLLRMRQWLNSNTKQGSKRNISAHYDLGNAFYTQWLDPTMTYSSALYQDGASTLEDAQRAKYNALALDVNLSEDQHVLEIGCGWGGFAEHAAKNFGARVTALTISQEQFDFAKERMFKAGLNEKVDIVFQDYRDERGLYDSVVSIEMFEAVGEKYWPVFFDKVQSCMKDDAKAAMQIITIQDALFEKYKLTTDFIQRYIFPGGMLPSPTKLRDVASDYGLEMTSERVFGHDYADTLAEWRSQFHSAWPTIQHLGFDARFKRMWDFYFYYCEAGFRSENIDVRHVVYSKS